VGLTHLAVEELPPAALGLGWLTKGETRKGQKEKDKR